MTSSYRSFSGSDQTVSVPISALYASALKSFLHHLSHHRIELPSKSIHNYPNPPSVPVDTTVEPTQCLTLPAVPTPSATASSPRYSRRSSPNRSRRLCPTPFTIPVQGRQVATLQVTAPYPRYDRFSCSPCHEVSEDRKCFVPLLAPKVLTCGVIHRWHKKQSQRRRRRCCLKRSIPQIERVSCLKQITERRKAGSN